MKVLEYNLQVHRPVATLLEVSLLSASLLLSPVLLAPSPNSGLLIMLLLRLISNLSAYDAIVVVGTFTRIS